MHIRPIEVEVFSSCVTHENETWRFSSSLKTYVKSKGDFQS